VVRSRYLAIFGLLSAFIVASAVAQDKKDPAKDPAKDKVDSKDKKDAPKETKKDEPKKDAPKETKKDEPKKDAPKEPKKEEPKKETPKGDGLTLAWKFTPNVSFYQKMTTSTDQNIKVMGLDVTQKQDQTFYFKWTPIAEKDGKWEIKQEIEGVQMKIDIAGNPVSFDSTQENPPGGTNTALAEFFKALKGSAFTLTFDPKTMKVVKVDGRDEFLKKLATANTQLEPLLKKILSEDALKEMADPVFGVLPTGSKKAGDTWEATSKLNLGPIGSYANKYVYTLKGPEPNNKDLEVINVATTLTYTAPTDSDPALPFKIKSSTLQTKEKQDPGKIVFNMAKGRLESADIKLQVSGSLTIEIGGNTTQVELTQTQTTTMNTSDKSLLPEPPKKP